MISEESAIEYILKCRDKQDFSSTIYAIRPQSKADKTLLESVSVSPDVVLDIGCGPGILAKQFLTAFSRIKQYLALDYSEELLEIAKNNISMFQTVCLIKAVPTYFPITTNSVNICLAINTLHHFEEKQLQVVLEEIKRVLIPQGQLILIEDWSIPPQNEIETRADELRQAFRSTHSREYPRPQHEWEQQLLKMGFVNVQTQITSRPFLTIQFDNMKSTPEGRDLLQRFRKDIGESCEIAIACISANLLK